MQRRQSGLHYQQYALCILACSVWISQVDAQTAEWPPLLSQDARQSDTVRVGDHSFTSGSYSWWVDRYVVNRLRYSRSINDGPRSWSATLGLEEDVSSENQLVGSSPAASSNKSTLTSSPALPLPALAALPRVPAISSALPSLPPLSSQQSPLPELPAIPELPALR